MASRSSSALQRDRSPVTDSSTFMCTNCKEPLRIHSSFFESDVTIHDLEGLVTEFGGDPSDLTTNIVPVNPVFVREQDGKIMSDSDASSNSRNGNNGNNGNNGFLIIGGNNINGVQSVTQAPARQNRDNLDLNYRMQVTARLFDILSSQSEIKHPLCEECADFVIDAMDSKLRSIEDECKVFKEFEESLKSKVTSCKDDTNNEIRELEEQLKQLELEEKELESKIEVVDAESKKLEEQLESQKRELKEIDSEESKYWKEYNNLKRQFFIAEDELQSISNQLRYTNGQLDRLRRTNVFNCTFHIWHSGHFGTVNGFRLGRLPTIPVEWSEINAAWGQCVLLLSCLAKKINLTFKRYRLVPYGNYSFIESLDDKSKSLPLYASGGFRFMWNSKFDSAMVAFLDCMSQFRDEVEKGDPTFRLPYKMDSQKGRIEDRNGSSYSIKIQFNSEEQWTKGLKYMLTNLKWMLAWVASNQFDLSSVGPSSSSAGGATGGSN